MWGLSEKLVMKGLFISLAGLICLTAQLGLAKMYKGLKPVIHEDGTVTFEDKPIPEAYRTVGLPDDAVGVWGFKDERWAIERPSPINTSGWTALDYMKYQERALGFLIKPCKDYTGDFQIDLVDKRGRKRTKKLYQFKKPYYGKEGLMYKSMSYFYYPPDIKGTCILLYKSMKASEPDNQWLYLPALRKIRRISAGQKMDSFGGTDVTNDMMVRKAYYWNYEFAGEETIDMNTHRIKDAYGGKAHFNLINGRKCVWIKGTPKDKSWPISYSLFLVDKERGNFLYEEDYDKGGKLLRTLHACLAPLYPKNEKYLTFGDWYCENVQSKSKTFMYLRVYDDEGNKAPDYANRDFSNYVYWFDTGWDEYYVSKRFMQKGTR